MSPLPGVRGDGPAGRTPMLAVVATLVVVLLLVAVGGYLLVRGDDTEPTGGAAATPSSPTVEDSSTTTTTTDGPTEEPDPLDDPTSPESLDLRYDALAGSVTKGFDRCRDVKARAGQRERVVCRTDATTLELVTYRKVRDLEARRDRAITYAAGGVLDVRKGGVLMAFEEENRRDVAASAFLYRDDTRARQSATYFAEKGTDLDGLVRLLAKTSPVRPYPTGPGAPELVDFADQWLDPDTCLRIETVNDGALEESYCDVRGPIEVYVGRFHDEEGLLAYRQLVLASSIVDEREVRDWNQREGDPPVGALYEYTTDSGAAVRYWDDPSCACYAEAFLPDGSYEDLQAWWSRG